MSREEQFDEMLLKMVQQHGDSFSDVFGTVFSFLARRTNFYTDGGEDVVEKLVINELKKCRNIAMINNDNKDECVNQEKKQKEDDSLILKLNHEFKKLFPAEPKQEDTEFISEDEKIRSLENFHLIIEALIHTKKAERAQRKKKQFLEEINAKKPIATQKKKESRPNTGAD